MNVDETALSDLAIIVVNYATSHLLQHNLSKVHQEMPEASIYVVDNLSTLDERTAVEGLVHDAGWRLVTPQGNVGFGGGCNAGAAAAIADGARTLLFLNPDALIDRRSVELMARRSRDRNRAIIAPVVLRPDGSIWFDGNDLNLADGSVRSRRTSSRLKAIHGSMPWLSGACFLIRVDFWVQLQGFDEDFFMYWEDIDLSFRAIEAGGELVVERLATAHHDEGASQREDNGTASMSPLYYRYNIRNRLLFAAKHLDDAAVRRWRLLSAHAGWRIIRRGRSRRELARHPRSIVNGLRATWEGLRLTGTPPSGRPLRVILSFPPPLPTSNPYNILMKDSLEAREDISVEYFSWRRVLLQRADVFHVHWPESALVASTALRAAGKHVFFALMVTVLRLRRTAWVRTVHNIELPQDISRVTRMLLEWADRGTTLRIVINPFTVIPPGQANVTIVHGHYIDWFKDYPRLQPEPGRISYVGTIRRYKGVPRLLEAFREIVDTRLTLEIAGRLSHQEYAEVLTELASRDDRVNLRLGFLDDKDLVSVVTRSQLVVLPYPEMHNSGMALCVLSLGRPVLVPNNAVNRALAEEVGPGWVHFFDGQLDTEELRTALASVTNAPPAAAPNLSERAWDLSGERHAAAYHLAVRLKRGFRPAAPLAVSRLGGGSSRLRGHQV